MLPEGNSALLVEVSRSTSVSVFSAVNQVISNQEEPQWERLCSEEQGSVTRETSNKMVKLSETSIILAIGE